MLWGTLQFIERQVKSSKSSEAFRELQVQFYRKSCRKEERDLGRKKKFSNPREKGKKKRGTDDPLSRGHPRTGLLFCPPRIGVATADLESDCYRRSFRIRDMLLDV